MIFPSSSKASTKPYGKGFGQKARGSFDIRVLRKGKGWSLSAVSLRTVKKATQNVPLRLAETPSGNPGSFAQVKHLPETYNTPLPGMCCIGSLERPDMPPRTRNRS